MDSLERVLSHIRDHHATDIRIESIASLLSMGDSSFSRFFAHKTGTSFTEFLNSVRVAHACELLSTTDRPITEISFDVGFNNVANFNRRFRQLKKSLDPSVVKSALQSHVAVTSPQSTPGMITGKYYCSSLLEELVFS